MGHYIIAVVMVALMIGLGSAMLSVPTVDDNLAIACGSTPGFCPNPPGCENTTSDINEC